VYAAGDCTCFPLDGGELIRFESLQNAIEQGELVARSIMDEDASYHLVPYFWSNQYDIKLKTVGLFAGYDDTIVRKGVNPDSFSVIYLRRGQVCAVDCVNAMKDYVDARRVIGARIAVDVVQNPGVRLRDAIVGDRVGDSSS
jgi:3-phenylpropionate/trans-cinnamate dioxygenase ferredoxin reductase subunit